MNTIKVTHSQSYLLQSNTIRNRATVVARMAPYVINITFNIIIIIEFSTKTQLYVRDSISSTLHY